MEILFKKERKEKKTIDIPPAEKYFCKWELGQDIFHSISSLNINPILVLFVMYYNTYYSLYNL